MDQSLPTPPQEALPATQTDSSDLAKIESILKLAGPYVKDYNEQKRLTAQMRTNHDAAMAQLQNQVNLKQLDLDHQQTTQRLWFNGMIIIACLATSCVIAWLSASMLATFLNVVSFIIGALFGEQIPKLRKVIAHHKPEAKSEEAE